MADLAELGLRVVNGQAVQAIRETDTALKNLGSTAETTNAAYDKTTRKIDESRGKFEAWKAQVGQTQPIAQHVTHVNSMATAHDKAAFNANRLRGGLTTLASSVIGLNPQVASLSSVLSSFAIGSAMTVGILAGVAAIGLAYNKLTEDSRKFKEQTDKLIESLVKQKQSLLDATLAGQQAQGFSALNAQMKAQEALRRFDAGGLGLGFTKSRAELVRDYQVATDALDQANANVIKKRKDLEEDAASAQKRNLAELAALTRKNATEADRYLDGLIQKAMMAARQISQMGYGNFTFAGGLDLAPIDLFPSQRGPTPTGSATLTYQQRQQAEIWTRTLMGDFVAPVKKAGAEVNRMAITTQIAANAIGSTISAITGKIGGGSIAANFGAGLGQAGASMLGGFGGTAFGQAIFGPIIGAFGSAVGAGVDAMFDFSGAAKQARIALENMSRAVESNIANFEARAYGTEGSLADQIRRAQEEAEQRRAEIEAKYRAGGAGQLFSPGTNPQAIRDAELARIDAAEVALIARLREADAIKAVTEEMNKLATAVRNAPSGFKVESYINRFAAARPWDYPGGAINQPFTPKGGPTGTGGMSISIGNATFEIKGNTGEALLKDVAFNLRKVAASTIGGNAPLEEAWEYV